MEADPEGWIFGKEMDVDPLFGGHFTILIPFPSWWSSVSGASLKLRHILVRRVMEAEGQMPKSLVFPGYGEAEHADLHPIPTAGVHLRKHHQHLGGVKWVEVVVPLLPSLAESSLDSPPLPLKQRNFLKTRGEPFLVSAGGEKHNISQIKSAKCWVAALVPLASLKTQLLMDLLESI